MIEYFHDLGYETTCNIMAISQAGSGQVGERWRCCATPRWM